MIIEELKNYPENTDASLTNGETEAKVPAQAGGAVAAALILNAPFFMDTKRPGIMYKN